MDAMRGCRGEDCGEAGSGGPTRLLTLSGPSSPREGGRGRASRRRPCETIRRPRFYHPGLRPPKPRARPRPGVAKASTTSSPVTSERVDRAVADDRREVLGGGGTRQRQTRQEPAVDPAQQRRDDALDVLVAHRAEDRERCTDGNPCRRGRARAPKRPAGCAPRRRPPSACPAGPGSDRRAPRRAIRCARLLRDRQTVGERGERRQRPRGVEQLVGPAQGRIRQAGAADRAADEIPLLPITRVVEVAADGPQVRTDGGSVIDHRARRSGSAQIAGRPARKMPAFSKPISSRVSPR